VSAPAVIGCTGCGGTLDVLSEAGVCSACWRKRRWGTAPPSELPRETDPLRRTTLEHEAATEQSAFDKDVRALREALARSEELVRDVWRRAQRLGGLRGPLNGQEAVSGRDRLLGPLRSEVAGAAVRLDQLAWS
jgi:hypothetical protein